MRNSTERPRRLMRLGAIALAAFTLAASLFGVSESSVANAQTKPQPAEQRAENPEAPPFVFATVAHRFGSVFPISLNERFRSAAIAPPAVHLVTISSKSRSGDRLVQSEFVFSMQGVTPKTEDGGLWVFRNSGSQPFGRFLNAPQETDVDFQKLGASWLDTEADRESASVQVAPHGADSIWPAGRTGKSFGLLLNFPLRR